MLLLHQFGGRAAHQQRRNGDPARGLDQRLLDLVGARADPAPALEEARVPVPAPAAVGMQPQVLLQPLVRARPRPVRQIGGDRVGGLGDRAEAFLACARMKPCTLATPSRSTRGVMSTSTSAENTGRRRAAAARLPPAARRCRRAKRRPPPAARRCARRACRPAPARRRRNRGSRRRRRRSIRNRRGRADRPHRRRGPAARSGRRSCARHGGSGRRRAAAAPAAPPRRRHRRRACCRRRR